MITTSLQNWHYEFKNYFHLMWLTDWLHSSSLYIILWFTQTVDLVLGDTVSIIELQIFEKYAMQSSGFFHQFDITHPFVPWISHSSHCDQLSRCRWTSWWLWGWTGRLCSEECLTESLPLLLNHKLFYLFIWKLMWLLETISTAAADWPTPWIWAELSLSVYIGRWS